MQIEDGRREQLLYEYVFCNNRYVRAFHPLSSDQLKGFEKSYGKCFEINKYIEELLVDKSDIRIQRKFESR